jgi:4'-phosphopantetheinyl transferase
VRKRKLIVQSTEAVPIATSNADACATLGIGVCHLWFATLDELRPDAVQFEQLLDDGELQRADRFRFSHDRERFVLGHGWLRTVLSRYVTTEAATIRYARGPHGKPYVNDTSVRFNFSDTKDAILVGLTSGMELGTDIETLAREVDHEAVSEHYFTPSEIEGIRNSSNPKLRFLELWTRKEAVLKASGVGIMDDLRVLSVDAPTNEMMIGHGEFVRMAAPTYHVRSLLLSDLHTASIATAHPLENVELFRAAYH